MVSPGRTLREQYLAREAQIPTFRTRWSEITATTRGPGQLMPEEQPIMYVRHTPSDRGISFPLSPHEFSSPLPPENPYASNTIGRFNKAPLETPFQIFSTANEKSDNFWNTFDWKECAAIAMNLNTKDIPVVQNNVWQDFGSFDKKVTAVLEAYRMLRREILRVEYEIGMQNINAHLRNFDGELRGLLEDWATGAFQVAPRDRPVGLGLRSEGFAKRFI